MLPRPRAATSMAVALLVLSAPMAMAEVCPRTGEDAPRVVTLTASKDNPTAGGWVVRPDCSVQAIEPRYIVQPALPTLTVSQQDVERVESVPSGLQGIYLTGNPLSQGGVFDNAIKLNVLQISGFAPAFLDSSSFPRSLKQASFTSAGLTSIDRAQLPDTLTYLDLSGNKLVDIKSALPGSVETLILNNNKFSTFDVLPATSSVTVLQLSGNSIAAMERVAFPSQISQIVCVGCGTSIVRGVRWPPKLFYLELSGTPITRFEIRRSDFPIFQKLDRFEANIQQTACSGADDELTTLRALSAQRTLVMYKICVVSDAKFETLYGGGEIVVDTPNSPTASTPGTTPKKKASTTPPGSPEKEGSTSASSESSAESDHSAAGSASTGALVSNSTKSTRSPTDPFSSVDGSAGNGSSLANGSLSSDQAKAVKRGYRVGENPDTPESVDSSSSSTKTIVIAIGVIATIVVVVIGSLVYRSLRNKRRLQGKETTGDQYTRATSPRTTKAPHSSDRSLASDWLREDDTVFGRLRIDATEVSLKQTIGHGGFGIVYRGEYQGRVVAVKQMLPNAWQKSHFVASFIDEIRLCATLDHPKIVAFVGVTWSSLRDLSVVIEFMPGGDLHALLHKQIDHQSSESDWFVPWTANRIKSKASIAHDVAEAVEYLHSFAKPIIHRDLKTSNVLLDMEGNTKLSDFGISREIPLDETMTGEIGTVAWIAPEVLRGERYSAKADIYSLGVVLVELDSCRHPYGDASGVDESGKWSDASMNGMHLALLVSTGKLRPSVSNTCPDAVKTLIDKCLNFEATHRPTAVEVVAEIQQWFCGSSA